MYTCQTYYHPSTITIAYYAHGILAGVASEMRKEGSFWSGFASGAVASFMTTTADVLTQNLCEAWQVTCMVAAGTLSGKIDYANAELGEDGYYTTSISFYETNDDLHYSFGTATVKYKVLDDNKIMYSGFKDTYNFDPKPWGVRSFKNEVITRTYNIISNGTEFSIYYNKTLF